MAGQCIDERILWNRLYPVVVALGKTHCFKGKWISDTWIVLTWFWATLHDRTVGWACQAQHWGQDHAWHGLPSNATMSRRLRTVSVLHLLEQVYSQIRDWFPRSLCKWIDGKPLPVGGASKDRDAKLGRAAGHKARGYKVHALVDAVAGLVDRWLLASLNVNEVVMAQPLLEGLSGGGYVSGDNQYDANRLYEAAAAANHQLLAPRRQNTAGLGHCRHSEHRLRCIERCENPLRVCGQSRSFGQELLAARDGIERCFGNWCSFAGGLTGPPPWIRRPHRVALWVQAKLIIHAIRKAIRLKLPRI